MPVIGPPIVAANPVSEVVCLVLTAYVIVLFIRILGSWFPMSPSSPAAPFFSFVHRLTEPVLGPARRLIPPIGGMFDISPLLVFFAIQILQAILGCRTGLF